MEKQIEVIEGLIKENREVTVRTPFLDVMLGGLITARDNAREHLLALARIAAAEKEAAGKAAGNSQ